MLFLITISIHIINATNANTYQASYLFSHAITVFADACVASAGRENMKEEEKEKLEEAIRLLQEMVEEEQEAQKEEQEEEAEEEEEEAKEKKTKEEKEEEAKEKLLALTDYIKPCYEAKLNTDNWFEPYLRLTHINEDEEIETIVYRDGKYLTLFCSFNETGIKKILSCLPYLEIPKEVSMKYKSIEEIWISNIEKKFKLSKINSIPKSLQAKEYIAHEEEIQHKICKARKLGIAFKIKTIGDEIKVIVDLNSNYYEILT